MHTPYTVYGYGYGYGYGHGYGHGHGYGNPIRVNQIHLIHIHLGNPTSTPSFWIQYSYGTVPPRKALFPS